MQATSMRMDMSPPPVASQPDRERIAVRHGRLSHLCEMPPNRVSLVRSAPDCLRR